MFRLAGTMAIAVGLVSTLLGPPHVGSAAMTGRRAVFGRDKSGTSGGQEKEAGSQVTGKPALTSRVSYQAEGTGLEPATPYGAPHFQ